MKDVKELPNKSPLPTNNKWNWHHRYWDVGDEVTLSRDCGHKKSGLFVAGTKLTITKITKNSFGRISYYAGKAFLILEDLMTEVRSVSGPDEVFVKWLNDAARIALGAEWEIDVDYCRWRQWFDKGLTPHEAVTCLFELVRQGKT